MEQQQSARAEAAAQVMDTAIRELTSLAIIAGLSWAILHRDYLTRAWMRFRRRPMSPEEAAEHRAVSDFARELAEDLHAGDRSPRVPGDGLYGGR